MEVVAAIIEDACGRILLAQRPAGKPLAGLWEFPGGKIELDETPDQAIVRELREELKLEVSLLRRLGQFAHRYAPETTIFLHVFVVKAESEPQITSAVAQFKWVGADQLLSFDLAPADLKPWAEYRLQMLDAGPRP